MPTAEDISKISAAPPEHFWQCLDQWNLQEKQCTKPCPNLDFNVEFAHCTGHEINLSNKQKKHLEGLRSGEKEAKMLRADLSLKVDVGSLKRRPIGFVTRGDYS